MTPAEVLAWGMLGAVFFAVVVLLLRALWPPDGEV